MAFAHGGEFGYWNGIDIPPPAVRPRPIATPGYTAEVQGRLAAQAQARAGLAAAPSIAPAVSEAAPALAEAAPSIAKAPGMMSRIAATMPTLSKAPDVIGKGISALGAGARTLGKFLPGAGNALAVGGEALGVADTAIDPNASKIDVGTRAAEGVGRLGAMGAGTGIGFVAGGPVGAAIGGAAGYFAPNAIYAARDWLRGDSSAPSPVSSAQAAIPAPSIANPPAGPTVDQGPLPTDEASMGARNLAAANAPGFAAPSQFGQATATPGGGGIIKTLDPNTGRPTYTDSVTSPGAIGTPVQNRVSTLSSPPSIGGPTSTPELSAARKAAADRGDWGAVQASYQANGGTWQGTTSAQDATSGQMAEAQARIKSAKTIPQAQAATAAYHALIQQETERQQNAIAQAASKRADLAHPAAQAHIQAQTDLYKQQTESAKQVEADRQELRALGNKYAAEPDPEKRRRIQDQMYAIQGKPLEKPTVIHPSIISYDEMGKPLYSKPMEYDPHTRQTRELTPVGGGTQPNTISRADATAIKQKTGYTDAQLADYLKKQGRTIGAN